MGNVYKQGIGRVVYKLQDGGSPPEDPNKRRNLPSVIKKTGSFLGKAGRVLSPISTVLDVLEPTKVADATLPQEVRTLQDTKDNRLQRAKEMGFDVDKVYYHGSGRIDRILEKDMFDKKRATSGPMAFFTENPEIASGYAKGKQDTSRMLEDGDYRNWFKIKAGRGKAKNLDNVFWNLSEQEKTDLSKNLKNLSIKEGLGGEDHWNYTFKTDGKRDPIKTAKELWLSSGHLYDREEEFIDVLKKAGLKKEIEYNSPFLRREGIIPVYSKVKNPLDTTNEKALKEVLSRLEEVGKRKRYKTGRGTGVDNWDKSSIGIREFADRLRDDIKEGTSHSWTSIPEEVTFELKDFFGYDGIKDRGGKYNPDNPQHEVLIPFEPEQVRSIFARFDPEKTDEPYLGMKDGGLVYKQGIGTLARKLQDGGEAKPVYEYGYTPTQLKNLPIRNFTELFFPVRREILEEENVSEIKGLTRTDHPNIFIDQQGKQVISPPGYNPETGEGAEFIYDINNPNQGTLRFIKPPVYGKAEVGAKYMPIAQILKNVPAGAKKTGQYIYDFLSDPETRTKAGENVTKVLGSIDKKAEAILYGQGDLWNNPSADYIEYEDGTRVGKDDVAKLMLNLSLIGGAGTAKADLGDTTFYSFIGGRFLSNVPDNMKVDNTTGKKLKANLNETRIESNRINNLSRSQITKELRNLGFKSQKSISPALQRKLLEEYKIRKTYGWHIGPDNKIRYEVSDQNVRLDKRAANLLVKNPGDYVKTEDIFKGTPVFKMYPDLKGTKVTYDPNLPTFGQYVTEGGSKTISVAINPNKHPETFKNILIHEVGHDVQDHMLFASGGNRNIASDLNERLGAIRESINTLEVRSSLGTLGPQDRSTLARLTADEGVLNGVLKNWKGLNLELKQAFAIENTGLNFSSKNAKINDLKNKIDLEETNLYRALSGEVYSRLDQRRAGLSPKERRKLSPEIPINQIRIQELRDQGYEVEDLSFDANPNKKINLIVRPRDGSNSLPPHVRKLKKEIEDTAKVERIAMNRRTPLDEEQDRVRKELDALTKEYYDFGVDVSSEVNKEKKRLIEELKKVIRVGETINLPRDRTKGLGRDKENLSTDMFSADTPLDDVIIKEPYFNSYRYQAMDGSSNIDKQTLIKDQQKRAEANVSLYKEREEIGKRSGLQKNAKEIQKAKDENALGPLAALLRKRNEIIKKDYPPTVFTEDNFPMLPLYQRAQNALDRIKRGKIIDTGVDQLNENKSTLSLKSGQKVDARLDIPSYERQGTWVPAIHPQKREPFPVGYPRTTQLRNVDFVQEGSSRKKALEVASGTKSKSPFATMTGNWVNHDSADLYRQAKKFLNDPDWTQIGYNPKRASYFYNTKTLEPVKNAEEVIQIGQLVLAKNVKYGKDIAKDFNRGGVVSRETRPTVFSTGIPTALRRETNAKF